MSKKYFVKYLPVAGEIKEGCMALKPAIPSLGINEPYIEDVNDYDVECLNDSSLPGHKFLKGSKLVKLFLCSKDTWYGDPPVGRYIYSEVNGNSITATKVIGEISPDATWVKEGQEFDEDEVNILVDYANTPAERKKIKIKGPCGHFH